MLKYCCEMYFIIYKLIYISLPGTLYQTKEGGNVNMFIFNERLQQCKFYVQVKNNRSARRSRCPVFRHWWWTLNASPEVLYVGTRTWRMLLTSAVEE